MRLVLLSTAVIASICTLSQAHAQQPQQYNVINLQAEASRQVANDEMHATLYIEKSNKVPAQLASEVNQTLNHAINLAKKYPMVKVNTDSQSTYPIYDDNNRKLKEWRSRAQIRLQSTDFNATSQLISELQQNFQTDSIQFSVSDQQRQKVENELLIEASKTFQQRAQTLTQAWNKSSYQMISFDVNSNGYYPTMASMPLLKSAATEHSIPEQDFAVGESTLRMNATGSIQLK